MKSAGPKIAIVVLVIIFLALIAVEIRLLYSKRAPERIVSSKISTSTRTTRDTSGKEVNVYDFTDNVRDWDAGQRFIEGLG